MEAYNYARMPLYNYASMQKWIKSKSKKGLFLMLDLESDEMTTLWLNDSFTFAFYLILNLLSNKMTKWKLF